MLATIESLTIVHYGFLNEGILHQPQIVPCQDANSILEHNDCRKPHGINLIWGSPYNSDFGWTEFCLANSMAEELLLPKWQIKIKQFAKIAKIHTRSEANTFRQKYPNSYGSALDWSKISTDYQAFWITVKGQANSLFNGWDCETFLIFNTNIIDQLEKIS